MVLEWLCLFSIYFGVEAYHKNLEEDDSTHYDDNDLLFALNNQYKTYKRSQIKSFSSNNSDISKYNDKRRYQGQSKQLNLSNIPKSNGKNRENRKDGSKRNTVVTLHVVTPIHEDDIGSKRGLIPQLNTISPIHDDEVVNKVALAAAVFATKGVESGTQKNIVPVHDDDDYVIKKVTRGQAINPEFIDDMETFITAVEKRF